MYQHLMHWLDSYAGHAESAVQFMTYESMHTIPNWDTHEANCDTDDPNRETYYPHNQTICGPDGR